MNFDPFTAATDRLLGERMTKHNINKLPEIDKQYVMRGFCPWCLVRLIDNTLIGGHGDACPECGDEFIFIKDGV